MKKLYTLLVLLLCVGMNAQVIHDGGLEGLRLMTKVSDDLEKVQGSPYWTEDFRYGTIHIGEKEPIRAFLRYDVRDEVVQIKTDPNSEDIYQLSNRPDISYFVDNKKIVADQITSDSGKLSGLFIEHFNGEDYRLLEKLTVNVSEPVQATSSYGNDKPAQMTISNKLFVVTDKRAKEVRLKKRDIKKMFPSEPARNYISDNKIKEVEDLVALLMHLDLAQ